VITELSKRRARTFSESRKIFGFHEYTAQITFLVSFIQLLPNSLIFVKNLKIFRLFRMCVKFCVQYYIYKNIHIDYTDNDILNTVCEKIGQSKRRGKHYYNYISRKVTKNC
jgi:hypothetical protein